MLLSNCKLKTALLPIALVAGLGLSLSACQVRPLYSTNTATGQTLSSELASIEIAPAKDRLEQEIRNNLIFSFTGGGEAASPLYRLEYDVNNYTDDLDIESGSGLAKTTRVRLTVTYKLIQLSDKTTATTGSSFFTADFSRTEQRFANDRALRDAENRAAEQVANDIHLRLAAYFAAGT